MENQAVKPPMLLIVESDPLLLTGMAAILDKRGYRCFLARTLDVARQAAESMVFDLILYSFSRDALAAAHGSASLRQYERMQKVPVIFLADEFDPKWIEPLNLAGGVYCLPKPFEPEMLLDLVDRAFCLPHLAERKVSPPKAMFAKDWVRLS
jgi:DNA-binding response OmpR family regulator